jgi:vacuolar-type H+-ATPase subunit D/Vma8
VLRRNAIERRWIPAHADTLAALELALEEHEREDALEFGEWREAHTLERAQTRRSSR